MQVRLDCTKFHLPHKPSGTTGPHAAKKLLLSPSLLLSTKLNNLPKSEPCLQLQNLKQDLLSGYPSRAEQSPPHDKPKATKQMQQHICTDPFHDAARSSINLHLLVQPTPHGKGRAEIPRAAAWSLITPTPDSSTSQKTGKAQDSGHHLVRGFVPLLPLDRAFWNEHRTKKGFDKCQLASRCIFSAAM